MENPSNNYPKITHLSPARINFKVDRRDPNFDRPLADLHKNYESPYKRTFINKPEYEPFTIIVRE